MTRVILTRYLNTARTRIYYKVFQIMNAILLKQLTTHVSVLLRCDNLYDFKESRIPFHSTYTGHSNLVSQSSANLIGSETTM
ncbi:hypothetical protein BX600DRAFT_471278 [Xylariales sp. PMI_506]|nr:hypothetical protein BX600DRAFT_471278 [Xylariales sp. PMI_506]